MILISIKKWKQFNSDLGGRSQVCSYAEIRVRKTEFESFNTILSTVDPDVQKSQSVLSWTVLKKLQA